MWSFWKRRTCETRPLADAPDWMVEMVQESTGWEVAKCQRVLRSATTEEYMAAGGEGPEDDHCYDPIEGDPAFAAILLRATLEAAAEADRVTSEGEYGYCHEFWFQKQRILRKRYGVWWQSPAELNPNDEFD